ncbi:putative equilibrative nucleoside transporter, MFS transporter superfamily [Helianthus annuus]|nr:putative equilibrative nucleoside transporter, MFS transporter superfamily [Helianthus annuus]KAJ0531563.1 putative equilibrative nucleoside transporter, MFS transporter superfamily [Helianthus annuus]KAJ0698402.1 putative equilibrative nucleoside transporter, MFS transporter superfamily [Helianthus annuus]
MESLKNESNDIIPKDTCKLAYIIHFLLGAGNLLPWNALITAIDYFGYLYPDKHVEKVFSVAYMGSSLLTLICMIKWSSFSRLVGFQVRMNVGFTMFVASLMVSPTLDWVSWHEKSMSAFYVVVASVVVCGLADGLVGGSLIGSAGKLPKEYMQAVFAGTASSGVLVSFLRIITKASLPHDPQGLKKSAHLYFLVSTVILLLCMVCCTLLYKLPVMEHHYKLQQNNGSASQTKLWDVARTIQWPALGIFIIYTVTLSIFPGFLAENIKSKLLKDWYPIILITIYNIADFGGKCFTAVYVLRSVAKATWGCLGRLLLYPLFSACLHGPKWVRNEVFVVFLTVVLGFTNGYLTSVIMILAPKSVPPSEAEMAAVVMALFLCLGLVSGSVLGWFWII